jgi:hypothetical protein
MCDAPSSAVFVDSLLNALLVLFTDVFFSPLVAIPVAAVTTGVTKRFIFHIHWISVHIFLYVNFFQPPFVLYSHWMILLRLSISKFYVIIIIITTTITTIIMIILIIIIIFLFRFYVPVFVQLISFWLLSWPLFLGALSFLHFCFVNSSAVTWHLFIYLFWSQYFLTDKCPVQKYLYRQKTVIL